MIPSNYKLISFDIFDTLLLRPYTNPQELWCVLEERTGAKGFAQARKKADAVTYRKSSDEGRETTIAEAYDIMPSQYRPLMQQEMELEREVLHPNPEMVALWDEVGRQGCRRVIVSDMYLPADFLKSVLEEKGIMGWDGFYLSSERMARKTTGKLFQIMLDEQKVSPSEVLHIGDNPRSDMAVPQNLGISIRPYEKVSAQFFSAFPFMRHINARLAGALSLAWHQYHYEHPSSTYWNKLGFSMAGVLGYLYISWIVEKCREKGITRLLFVGRDGYILQKICNTIYPDILTAYFFAPRLVSIQVLGAIGSDPVAIADRQRYMEEHAHCYDPDETARNYATYLSQFHIDEHTAMVDGCSSGFSAQRLVEKTLGHPVFSFYLMAMAPTHNAAALYQSKIPSLPFQGLSEFLFGAPTPPIKTITADGPVYEDFVDEKEHFKMSVCEEILQGALSCVTTLSSLHISLSPIQWLDYADTFMLHLTDEDKQMLGQAYNAKDVQHTHYVGVVWNPRRQRDILTLFGTKVLYVEYSLADGYNRRTLKLMGIPIMRKQEKWWSC